MTILTRKFSLRGGRGSCILGSLFCGMVVLLASAGTALSGNRSKVICHPGSGGGGGIGLAIPSVARLRDAGSRTARGHILSAKQRIETAAHAEYSDR